MFKHNESLLNNLHKFFRSDPFVKSTLESSGDKLNDINLSAKNVGDEFWFDTMSATGIAILENQLDFRAKSVDLLGKRNELEARWKTAGKCDLELLQVIANSWRNGEVAIMFTNACIKITFISVIGIPRDIDSLKFAINEAKPAHLPVEYTFRYRTWGNLLQNTWGYYKQFTWGQVLRKEGI